MVKRGVSCSLGLAIFAVLVLLATSVFAQGSINLPKSYQDLVNNIDDLKAQLKDKDAVLPPGVGSLFGNDVIRINVALRSGGEGVLGIIVIDKKVSDIVVGSPSNPTIVVEIEEKILDAILADDSPVAALEYALNVKLITYSGVTFAAKMKIGAIKTFLKIISLFTGKGTTAYNLNIISTPTAPPVIPVPASAPPAPAPLRVVGLNGACTSDLECSGAPSCVGNTCECSAGVCKVAPGYLCNHGGECSTTFCLGRPSDQGIKFFCSCRQDRHDTFC